MKIAIHYTKESVGFAKRWINYCQENNVNFKIVNCFANDIIHQLDDCDALMWHFSHTHPSAFLFAKQLLSAVEQSGKKVFPDYRTNWHFDDKVGQKYILEAIGAPLVPTFVFYNKQEAISWVKNNNWPKVFKLRGGAGSANVKLIQKSNQGKRLITKAFGKGISNYNRFAGFKEKKRKFRMGSIDRASLMKGFLHIFIPPKYSRVKSRERGYIYFQDFIPDNKHDIRIVVIDNKAFAIKRMARHNDFRASGSGIIFYEREQFDEDTVRLAFDLAERLNGQSIAFDFVYENNVPKLLEISYGFVPEVYDPCRGYWERSMRWIEGNFNPYGWMVDALIRSINV